MRKGIEAALMRRISGLNLNPTLVLAGWRRFYVVLLPKNWHPCFTTVPSHPPLFYSLFCTRNSFAQSWRHPLWLGKLHFCYYFYTFVLEAFLLSPHHIYDCVTSFYQHIVSICLHRICIFYAIFIKDQSVIPACPWR